MDFHLIAIFISLLLAFLFWRYGRKKPRDREPKPLPVGVTVEPDPISTGAKKIVEAHNFFSLIWGFVIIGVVIYGAFVDSMMRIIVIITIVMMVVIWLLYRKGIIRR